MTNTKIKNCKWILPHRQKKEFSISFVFDSSWNIWCSLFTPSVENSSKTTGRRLGLLSYVISMWTVTLPLIFQPQMTHDFALNFLKKDCDLALELCRLDMICDLALELLQMNCCSELCTPFPLLGEQHFALIKKDWELTWASRRIWFSWNSSV